MTHRHAGFDEVLAGRGWDVDRIQAFRERSVEVRRKVWDALRRDLHVMVAEDVDQDDGLLLNSWGWVQAGGETEGILLPLGRRLAVIFSLEERSDAGVEFGPLTGSNLEQARDAMLNARTDRGVPPPDAVVGHPSDRLFDC